MEMDRIQNGEWRDRELCRAGVWRTAGWFLRERREAEGWSQEELAQRAGIPAELVSAFERGTEHRPALEDWWRVTRALHVELVYFLRQAEQYTGISLLEGVARR